MTELECQSNQTPAIKSQKTELNQTIEELENALRDKEEVRSLHIALAVIPSPRFASSYTVFMYASGNGKAERGIGKHE